VTGASCALETVAIQGEVSEVANYRFDVTRRGL
jgi:hypothetical protein